MSPQETPNLSPTLRHEASDPKALTLFSLAAAVLLLLLLFATLSQTGGAGVLVVRTEPAHAKVVLQQVELGDQVLAGMSKTSTTQNGEVRFTQLPVGAKVRVVVSAKGHKSHSATGELPTSAKANEVGPTLTLDVKLRPQGGLLTVITEPEGASVYLASHHKGKSPALLSDLPPGVVKIEARLVGFLPAFGEIDIEAGGDHKLTLTLKPVAELLAGREPKAEEEVPAGQAQVQLVSSHACTFFIDNYLVGKHSLSVVRNISPGEHLFGCRADKGFGTRTKRQKLKVDSVSRVEFAFDEDPIDKAKRAQDANDPLHWDIRGGGARGEGKVGTAVEYFKKALELDPNYYPAHRQLSRSLPFLKEWDEAIYHAKAYLKGNPDAPDKKFTQELIQTMERKKLEEETGEVYEDPMPISRRRKKK
ncbi:MAG: PEGA domain-containing protein [Deltaproteobacteria bacterium]|nr:PEGA domain-containing protein [Deltaproteobacteria bacterium]